MAPLKELQNLAEQFVEIENEHKGSLQAEATELKKSKSAAVAAAKDEGVTEGRKVATSLIAFLGYASLLRNSPTVSSKNPINCSSDICRLILNLTKPPNNC